MSFLRMPFVRTGVTVALIGLFCLSVLIIKNIVTAGWQTLQREDALYAKSPNCSSRTDPTLVDKTLPPCEDFTAAVIAKLETAKIDSTSDQDYYRKHHQLILRFDNGQVRTVGDIYQDMWYSIHVGDSISVKFWRREVQTVSANGYTSGIFNAKKWDKDKRFLFVWAMVGGVCLCCLDVLWRKPRAQRNWPFLFR